MVIARVVTKREEPRLALATTAAAALSLAAVVVDDLVGASFFRPPDFGGVYGAVAMLISLAGIGPWLGWTSRGRTGAVTFHPGLVRAGQLDIHAADVTALHIARARRGRSVAIACGPRVVFLEVERADEAQRIAAALNVPSTPFGDLGLRGSPRWGAPLQLLVAGLALAFGALYFLATRGFDPIAPLSGKAVFGIGGVVVAWLSLAVLLTRQLAPGRAVAVGRGAWDAHVALQYAEAERAAVDTASTEGEKDRRTLEQTDEVARHAPVRIANLQRGHEQIGAWLARLDAISPGHHAYRDDALRKDELWETLRDDGAPVDTRMAAARVLRRRYGEQERALVRVIIDDDVCVRVVAALEEQHDEAEERLERLGPLFKAR